MKKRLLSLLLCLVMVFSLLPVNVLAAEVEPVAAAEEEDGVLDDPVQEEEEPEKIATGEESAAGAVSEGMPETVEEDIRAEEEDLPDEATGGVTEDGLVWEQNDQGGVTIIGFTDGLPAESAIPSEIEGYPVTEIRKMAFLNCAVLTDVTVPGSVTAIGEYAFLNCANLANVNIPAGVAKIAEGTFKMCSSLESISIPAGVSAVGDYAFMDCAGLKSVTVPGSVTSIGQYAFFYCENLIEMTIPEGVTEIGFDAFMGCSRMESVTIPASVTGIDENAFKICSALKTITFTHAANDQLAIGENAFHRNDSGATIVRVPDPEHINPAVSGYDWTGSNRIAVFEAIHEGADDGNPETADDSAPAAPDALALDREYLILAPGESVALAVTGVDEAWLPYVTWHWEPAEENVDTLILTVADGKVTAMTAGTAYVIASLTAGGETYSARCRVDVVEGEGETPVYDEVSVQGIRLPVTKATVELFKTDYTKVRIELMLGQNMAAQSNVIPQGEQDLAGVGAIRSARFLNETAAALFDLRPADDGTLEIIPKDSALAQGESAPKSIKGSYKTQIAVTIEGKELTAQGTLTLTVKKSLPGIKAKALKLNSFLTSDGQALAFTGGTVTAAELNPAKTQPGWLAFSAEDGTVTYTGAADAKKSGKLYLLVTAEGWAIRKAVTVSVSAAKSAPKLTFKPESLSLLPVGENFVQTKVAVSPALFADAETFPVRVSRVTEMVNKAETAAEDALAVDYADGVLTVRPAAGLDTEKAHTFNVYLSISGPAEMGMPAVEKAVTVKTPAAKAPAVTVKTYGAIDLAVKESRTVLKTTAKEMPAETLSVAVGGIVNAKTQETAADRFLIDAAGTEITLKAGEGLAKGTYTVTVLTYYGAAEPARKNVNITVKESAAGKVQPSISLKASGSIDVLRPGTRVTLTPTVKNCFTQTLSPGDLTVTRTYDSARKAYVSEDVTDWFNVTLEDGKYVVAPKSGVALCHADKFNVKAVVQAADAALYSNAVTLKVAQGKVKVKQSVKSITLLKYDRYSEGEVRLTLADPTLSGIARVELDSKSAAKFDLKDLGNGTYAIGYAGDRITTTKGVTVTLRVFMIGNRTTKPTVTLSVKVNIK